MLVEETLKHLVNFFCVTGPVAVTKAFQFTAETLKNRAARIAKLILEHAPSKNFVEKLRKLAESPDDPHAQSTIRAELSNLLTDNAELRVAIGKEIDQSHTVIQQVNRDSAKGTVVVGNVGKLTIS